jgi:hypothetical protein
MGQQQIILLILGTIITGIAIAVGITMFQSSNISANKDAMMNDINNLVGNAQAYYVKPGFLGGGNRSFISYKIPSKMQKTENGTYTFTSAPTMNTVFLTATSAENDGIIKGKIDIFHNQLFGDTCLNAFDDSGD